MTDKVKKIFGHIWSVLKYALIPIWIVVLIPGIPIIIIYSIVNVRLLVKGFRKKHPSKRFLIINKNDSDYIRVYNETLEKRIGLDSVVLNEIDLQKTENRLEKKIYKSGLSWKNYLPAMIEIDSTINRIGLYYAFKDYLKGKRKRINKILKNLSEKEVLPKDMTTFQNYIDSEMQGWLKKNSLECKKANIDLDIGAINLIFNDNYCIKIYDRLGHGFGVNTNLADRFDESIYDNDFCNLTWVFKYFQLKESADFSQRTESQYLENIPILINDLKKIIPLLNKLTLKEWSDMKEWINKNCT